MNDFIFHGDPRYDFDRKGVNFDGRIDGREVVHRISTAALQDYFGSTGERDTDLAAFAEYKDRIHELARTAALTEEVNDTGGAEITTVFLKKIRFER